MANQANVVSHAVMSSLLPGLRVCVRAFPLPQIKFIQEEAVLTHKVSLLRSSTESQNQKAAI